MVSQTITRIIFLLCQKWIESLQCIYFFFYWPPILARQSSFRLPVLTHMLISLFFLPFLLLSPALMPMPTNFNGQFMGNWTKTFPTTFFSFLLPTQRNLFYLLQTEIVNCLPCRRRSLSNKTWNRLSTLFWSLSQFKIFHFSFWPNAHLHLGLIIYKCL